MCPTTAAATRLQVLGRRAARNRLLEVPAMRRELVFDEILKYLFEEMSKSRSLVKNARTSMTCL